MLLRLISQPAFVVGAEALHIRATASLTGVCSQVPLGVIGELASLVVGFLSLQHGARTEVLFSLLS